MARDYYEMARNLLQMIGLQLVGGLLTALSIALVGRWLARSRNAATDAGELRYPQAALIVGVVFVLFCSGLAVLFAVKAQRVGWILALFFLLFVGPGLFAILDAVKTNFLVTLGGLRFSLPVSGNGFVSWDSIVQVEWSRTWRKSHFRWAEIASFRAPPRPATACPSAPR